MATEVVLDASALLAFLQDEDGATTVQAVLEAGNAVIGAVNLAEVVGKLAERGLDAATLDAVLDDLALDVVPFSPAQARTAGLLRPPTRALGLSLGDRACLALARERNATALTADRAWAEADLGIAVQVLGR